MKSIIKGYKKLFKLVIFIVFIFFSLMHISISNERLLEEAESLFKTGSFLEAVSKISDVRNIEAKIFCARTLAIYGYFLMQGDEAIEIFLKARKYAEEAVV